MKLIREKIESPVHTEKELACRTKVPGGWLVSIFYYWVEGKVTTTFLPDPEHTWDGNSLE